MAANTETAPVKAGRTEYRLFCKFSTMQGFHSLAYIGYPPNECSDVVAAMGRCQ